MSDSTEDIYDQNAMLWSRRKPNSLSDFTGRPAVFDLFDDIKDKKILDIGCGEGYCARFLAEKGARGIEAIDISSEMIKQAKKIQKNKIINYQVGNIKKLDYKSNTFEIVLGMFVFNYLTIEDMFTSFKEVYRVLKKGGTFIFSVPHPAFAFIKKELSPPFYFDVKSNGYFNARNKLAYGEISCFDGKKLPVQMIHKQIADYFSCLTESHFNKMPIVKELGVMDEHLKLNENFFKPVHDIPLHMAFKVKK